MLELIARHGAARCRVTITTDLPLHPGIRGAIERAVSRSYLSRVYAAELLRIDEQARKVVTDDRSRG